MAILCFPLLVGCGALGAFNAFVPQDAGVTVALRGEAYGPEPRQTLDVFVPPEGTGSGDVVIFVYGGSWNSGRRQDYTFVGRAFAARGFVTVLFDYRLVPEARYPEFVQDGAKAVAWTRRNIQRFGGDPRKLHLVGHSAGAYIAMMVALAPEFLDAEGLSPAVLDSAVGLSGPYDFLPLDVPETQEAFKGVENLPRTQPVNRVRPRAPTPSILLVHGEADRFVLPRNSAALAAALREAGHRVEERTYAGVDHRGTLLSLAKPFRDDAPVLRDVAAFLLRQ
ncbi:MAG TPA: alpha/beta hydrolase [Mesorhizobium sp.]|nr:alpha/beta hydrolase [Mesorhizobium sp.]